jgi:sugar/nucleoside kinase (ribokinase family)
MSILHPILADQYVYNRIIGTGGIGSGMFFSFDRDETLGRNESRPAQLLPYKDFCKQHIILHYLAVLLGGRSKNNFEVHPIGAVGNDDNGKSLVSYMKSVGMFTDHVHMTNDAATLFSVCYQYPDRSGGNITTANSASNLVTVADIENYFEKEPAGKKCIVLSVPEVPLAPRIKLLEEGRRRNYLNISSILSSEAEEFRGMGGFTLTDIISVNIDEAARIGKSNADENDHEQIINSCIEELLKDNPRISILITNGSDGVNCYADNQLIHYPAFKVNPVSTAGAGDAFIAGTIAGLCCGLPLAEKNKETAIDLGLLLAALSVTSADTINTKANADELYSFAKSIDLPLSHSFLTMFNH